MYDPTIGQFVSRDRAYDNGVELLFEHPYVYARNNPVNRIDPSGLQSSPQTGASSPDNQTRRGPRSTDAVLDYLQLRQKYGLYVSKTDLADYEKPGFDDSEYIWVDRERKLRRFYAQELWKRLADYVSRPVGQSNPLLNLELLPPDPAVERYRIQAEASRMLETLALALMVEDSEGFPGLSRLAVRRGMLVPFHVAAASWLEEDLRNRQEREENLMYAGATLLMFGGTAFTAAKFGLKGVALAAGFGGAAGAGTSAISQLVDKYYHKHDKPFSWDEVFLSGAAGVMTSVATGGIAGQLATLAPRTALGLSITSSVGVGAYEAYQGDPVKGAALGAFGIGLSLSPLAVLKIRSGLVGRPNAEVPGEVEVGSARLRRIIQFLKDEGVDDVAIRKSIVRAGLTEPIGPDTPITLERFRYLFPRTIAQGKQFKGRLGDIETRVATLEESVGIERSGLRPAYERRVTTPIGSADIDLIAINPQSQQIVRAVQLVRALPRRGNVIVFDDRESIAARVIERFLGATFPEFIVTGP